MHTTYDNALHEIVLITKMWGTNLLKKGINWIFGLLLTSDFKRFNKNCTFWNAHGVKKHVASTQYLERLISLGISIPKYLAVLGKVQAVCYKTCKTFWAS